MTPARLVFPALRWNDRTPDDVWPEVRRALDLGVGGFVVFGGSVAGMRELTARALDYAARPVLFAADLERGAGQQLRGGTALPAPGALAGLGHSGIAEAARVTAREAAAAGIGWVLAPVADLDVEPANPIVGTRSFGADPVAVADAVRVWIESAQHEGVHACAKHFPGHGRTTADSHAELPVVEATADMLEADLTPFRTAVAAGVRSVMMAHVSYPELDPSGAPASLSAAAITLLRDELGFDGLVASDAMIMEAVAASGRSESEVAVQAVRAGCDVLLYPASADAAVGALTQALDSRALDRDRVAEAVNRVDSAAAEARIRLTEPAPAPSSQRALELAAATIRPLRGSVAPLRSGERVQLHIVDDDLVSDRGPPGAAPGSIPLSRDRFAQALENRGVRPIDPQARDDAEHLLAIFCDVRGWKGRSGLARESVRALDRIVARWPDARLVLFGHPRIADQLPRVASVVCAWSGDPLMQDAAAVYLTAAARR